jgi:hypothetical protein
VAKLFFDRSLEFVGGALNLIFGAVLHCDYSFAIHS